MAWRESIHIGTSGWHYGHWKGTFYPEEMPEREYLDEYAKRFRTVEINNTFYRLPGEETLESWRDAVPVHHARTCSTQDERVYGIRHR